MKLEIFAIAVLISSYFLIAEAGEEVRIGGPFYQKSYQNVDFFGVPSTVHFEQYRYPRFEGSEDIEVTTIVEIKDENIDCWKRQDNEWDTFIEPQYYAAWFNKEAPLLSCKKFPRPEDLTFLSGNKSEARFTGTIAGQKVSFSAKQRTFEDDDPGEFRVYIDHYVDIYFESQKDSFSCWNSFKTSSAYFNEALINAARGFIQNNSFHCTFDVSKTLTGPDLPKPRVTYQERIEGVRGAVTKDANGETYTFTFADSGKKVNVTFDWHEIEEYLDRQIIIEGVLMWEELAPHNERLYVGARPEEVE